VKRKGWTFWLVLGAILLITLNLPLPVSRAVKSATRDLLAPLQELATSYTRRFKSAGDAIRGWGGLPEKNQELQREVMKLRRKLAVLEDLRRENFLLRQQLDFRRRSERELVPGSVLARDISGWWQTVRIQHGGSPLVRPDLAVMSSEGLVGRVTEVSGRTADVLLISDPACRVAVRIGDKGAFAVLQGRGLSWRGRVVCEAAFINKNISVKKGDVVTTSGLGGVFPAGIEVGVIESVTRDENNLHQSADVRPSADLSDLNVVFIVATEEEDVL